jgi:hypothetical protein
VRGAPSPALHIHDVTPTLLFALGLPVAADMPGRAQTALFSAEHTGRHPLRTIATWGRPREGRALSSDADAALIEELQALGYLR